MRVLASTLAVVLLIGVVKSQTGMSAFTAVLPPHLQPIPKGLTFQATVWPSYESHWAGRFSCNNCNPFEGDVPCSKALPILCLNSGKNLLRPLYQIQSMYTPFAVLDGGYYDGWTGGVLTVTRPVRGSDISSYQKGD